MKICLVRPSYQTHIITPPLGLGYLAAYLKKSCLSAGKASIKAKIIDALKENLTTEEVVKKVIKQKPDAVGITCLTAFYNETINLSRALKSKGLKVIIGGVHPTFLPYQTLIDSGADFVVCGEGEIALTKLVKSNFRSQNIAGVYSRKNLKEYQLPTKAEAVQNLDLLPFPDWPQLDPNTYPKAPHGAVAKHFPIGVIMTTRGCPYQCTFCASRNFYDQKIRYRSPENVIKEIKYLVRRFKVREICFEDDNLTLKREHVEKICQLILKNHLKISWSCPNGIRADRVDEDLLRLMKKSGCYLVAFGIESANSQILKNVKKMETLEVIEKSIKLAHKVGLECQGFFIFGLPGETKESLQESINFAKRSKLSRAQFVILDILPGSELWDQLQGKFAPNWTKDSYREPEWIPDGITREQLISAQTQALRSFYLRPKILIKMAFFTKPQQLQYLWKRFWDYHLFR